jgi:hypothetical protein
MDAYPVAAKQRYRRGVDVDVIEDDQVTDVGDRHVNWTAVCALDPDAVVLAADPAWLGEPVRS